MKIVINKCYGGFGLSTEAMKKLIKRGCRAITVMTIDEYTGGRGIGKGVYEILNDVGDGFQTQAIESVLFKDGNVYMYEYSNRHDQDLVAVVEEMGSKLASQQSAKLKVVEIPDGVDYAIDNYDGIESVHEQHRVWD